MYITYIFYVIFTYNVLYITYKVFFLSQICSPFSPASANQNCLFLRQTIRSREALCNLPTRGRKGFTAGGGATTILLQAGLIFPATELEPPSVVKQRPASNPPQCTTIVIIMIIIVQLLYNNWNTNCTVAPRVCHCRWSLQNRQLKLSEWPPPASPARPCFFSFHCGPPPGRATATLPAAFCGILGAGPGPHADLLPPPLRGVDGVQAASRQQLSKPPDPPPPGRPGLRLEERWHFRQVRTVQLK